MSGEPVLFRAEAEANRERAVHGAHGPVVELAHALAQAGFVDGAYLLEQDHAVAVQTHALPGQLYMGRQPRLARLARYRGRDDRGAVPVARVVLNDEHRAHPALFAAHHRAKVGIVDVSSFDHAFSHSGKVSPNTVYVGC